MGMKLYRAFLAGAAIVACTGCRGSVPEMTADTIFTGGTIITVNDAAPSADALAVKDGRILVVGAKADVLKAKGPSTKLVDLGGKTMIPGIIDPHSHIMFGMGMINQANVSSPPVGPTNTPQEIVVELRKFAQAKSIKPEQGKLADLAILSANPLTVQPDAIKDIKVVETIKDGKTIYTRPQ